MKKLGGQGRDSNPRHGYSRVPYRGTVALDHSATYPSVIRNVVPGFDRRRAKNVVTVNSHDAWRHGEGLLAFNRRSRSKRSAKVISSDAPGWVWGPSIKGSRLSQLFAINSQTALSTTVEAFSAFTSASTAYCRNLSL
jgi:hypothetical protein